MTSLLEISWGGVDICKALGLVVTDFEADPPQPKKYAAEIPYGNDIDLTDAITGHAAFENRSFKIGFFSHPDNGSFSELSTMLMGVLNGVRSEFSLSVDPGFTYSGRASVTGIEYMPRGGGKVEVEIDAQPWKVKERHSVTVDAVGGKAVACVSGLRPVHPTITCAYPVVVEFEGARFTVPSGKTYRMNLVTFHEGENELWVNVYRTRRATWEDLASSTWDSLSGVRWGGVSVGEEGAGDDFTGDGTVTIEWSEEYL